MQCLFVIVLEDGKSSMSELLMLTALQQDLLLPSLKTKTNISGDISESRGCICCIY